MGFLGRIYVESIKEQARAMGLDLSHRGALVINMRMARDHRPEHLDGAHGHVVRGYWIREWCSGDVELNDSVEKRMLQEFGIKTWAGYL